MSTDALAVPTPRAVPEVRKPAEPNTWRDYFARWPKAMPRRGVVVAIFDQVPFINFALSDETILLERQAPDTTGARMVVIPYGNIHAVKITEVINPRILEEQGFRLPVPQKR
jgi:hypothetical protein